MYIAGHEAKECKRCQATNPKWIKKCDPIDIMIDDWLRIPPGHQGQQNSVVVGVRGDLFDERDNLQI